MLVTTVLAADHQARFPKGPQVVANVALLVVEGRDELGHRAVAFAQLVQDGVAGALGDQSQESNRIHEQQFMGLA